MTDKQIDILKSSWEMYQNLAKGFAENCWKIKTVGIGFWSAIISYGYKNNNILMFYFSIFIVIIFFLMESGMRRLQYKYISKSIQVEKTINDFLVGAEPILPEDGISTNIDVPSIKDFLNLLRLRRWMFWSPYLSLLIISIALITLSKYFI